MKEKISKALDLISTYGCTVLAGEIAVICFETDNKFLKAWAVVSTMTMGFWLDKVRGEVFLKK